MATNDNTPNPPKQKITINPGYGKGQPVPARKLPKISLQKGAVAPKADTENLKAVPPPPVKGQTTRIKLPPDMQGKSVLRPTPAAPDAAIPPAPGADAVRDAAMNATARILIDQEVVRSPGALVIPPATEVTGKTIRIDPAQIKFGPDAGETAAAAASSDSSTGSTVKLDLSTAKPVTPTTQIDPSQVSNAKMRPEIPSAKDKSTSQTMRIDLSSVSSSTAKLASGPVPATETTRIKLPDGATQKVVPTAMRTTTPITTAPVAPAAIPVARPATTSPVATPVAAPVAKMPEPPKAVPVATPVATTPVTPVAKMPEPPKAVPVAAPAATTPMAPVAKAPEPPKAVPVATPAATTPMAPVAKAPEPPKAVPVATPAATTPMAPVAKAPELPKAVPVATPAATPPMAPVAKAPEPPKAIPAAAPVVAPVAKPATPTPAQPQAKREPIQMVVKPVWPGVKKAEPKPVEAVKPPEPVAAPKPVEAVKPPEPVAAPKPVEAVKPPEPVAAPKPVEAVKPPQPVAAPKPVEAVKPPQPVVAPKPVEAVKPPQPVVAPKPVEAVKPPQPVAPPKPVEAPKPPAPSAPTEPPRPRTIQIKRPTPGGTAPSIRPLGAPKPVEAPKIEVPKKEETVLTPPPVDQLAATMAISLPDSAETMAIPTQATAPAAPAPDSEIFLKATMALDAEKIAEQAAEYPAEDSSAPRPKTIMIKRPTSVTSATAKTVKTLRPPEQDSMIARSASGIKTIKLSRPGAPEGIPSHKKSSTSKVDLPEDMMAPDESGSRKRTVKIKRPGGAQIAPSVTTDSAAMSDGKMQAAGRTFDFNPVVATGNINIAWTIFSILGFLVAAVTLWVVLATAMPDKVPPPPGIDKFKMVDW